MRHAMADSFGARIETRAGDGVALCLVIGDTEPMAAIAAVEGKPVSLLGNGRVLALIRLDSLPALRQQIAVRHAGPVNVDRNRLAAFARLTGNALPTSPKAPE